MIHGPVGAPVIPGGGVAVVGGFHGAVVVVAAVDLGVAVVEAAAGVVVLAVNHPVLPLRLVVDRGAFRVVLAQAHARLDEDAVDLVAHDRNRRHVGDREVVKSTHGRAAESAAGRLGEVVVLGGLVVDGGDPAVGVGAERVLRGRVGVSARIRNRRRDGLDDADVQGLAVRLAQDLVERAVVGGVQRARGAVGGHAGVAGGGVDVTWALRPGRRNIGVAAAACSAIVNVAPISVRAPVRSISTRLILVFMLILSALPLFCPAIHIVRL